MSVCTMSLCIRMLVGQKMSMLLCIMVSQYDAAVSFRAASVRSIAVEATTRRDNEDSTQWLTSQETAWPNFVDSLQSMWWGVWARPHTVVSVHCRGVDFKLHWYRLPFCHAGNNGTVKAPTSITREDGFSSGQCYTTML